MQQFMLGVITLIAERIMSSKTILPATPRYNIYSGFEKGLEK
jgi:hypothetical protein